jgi:O-antigen/teichoic acid export membrane protein
VSTHKIVTDALHLSGARVWSLLLAVGTTYATARLLGPRDFGLLAAFNLVPQIAAYGSLGWDSAATRELPHLRASGRAAAAVVSRETAYTAELTTAVLWLVVSVVVAVFMERPATRVAALLGGAAVVIGKVTRLFAIDAFVAKDFRIQARVAMLTAAASAICQTLGAWLAGAVAAFGGVVLANAIGLLLYWFARPMDLTLRIDRRELWRLTVVGAPLALLGLLSGTTGATVYLERTLIGSQAGLAILGQYVFAGSLNNYLVSFIGDYARSWQPHLLEALARPTDRHDRDRWLTRPGLALSYAAAFVATCMLAGVPLLIDLLLPAYAAVIPMLPIMLLAGLIACLSYVPGNFLLSAFADQQVFYTKLWAVAIGLFGATLWGVLRAGGGLAWIAAAAIVPPLVVASVAIPKAYSYYAPSWRVAARHTLRLLAPLVYVVGVHGLGRLIASAVHVDSVLVREVTLAAFTVPLTLVPLGLLAWRTFEGSRLKSEMNLAS